MLQGYETVYLGSNNLVKLRLTDDGVPKDLTNVTRVKLFIGNVVVDSDSAPTAITWSGSTLTLNLGGESLVPGNYNDVRLVVYDPDHASGLVWGYIQLAIRKQDQWFTTFTYATIQDMVDRFGDTELTQLTDFDNGVTRNDAIVKNALEAAFAEVNSRISKVVPVPLETVPPYVVELTCDIARYRLYRNSAPEEVRTRYDDAITFLNRVGDGKATLGIDEDLSARPANLPRAAKTATDRTFTKDSLKSF